MRRSTGLKTRDSLIWQPPFFDLRWEPALSLQLLTDWGFGGLPELLWFRGANFYNFLPRDSQAQSMVPTGCLPLLGVVVTIAEAGLGILLILGFATRMSALLTGMMTLAFGSTMTFVLGVHAPLNYSVFVFSAASFLLASQAPDALSIDKFRELNRSRKEREERLHSPIDRRDFYMTNRPTVLVTGASQGIGAAIVQAFLRRNYNVVATSRNISNSWTRSISTSRTCRWRHRQGSDG